MASLTEDNMIPAATDHHDQDAPASSPGSASSRSSHASSFAYLLRDRRSDKRLLHKRSQPPEHLQMHTSSPRQKRPEPTRSPSYYKPKIVEDTLTPLPHVSHASSPTSPTLAIPSLSSVVPIPSAGSKTQRASPDCPSPSASPSRRPQQHSRSPQTPITSARKKQSHSPNASPVSRSAERPQLPELRHSDSTLRQKRPVSVRPPLRIELPSGPGVHGSRDEIEMRNQALLSPVAHRDSTYDAFARATGPFTPLGMDTVSPRITHGDNYFRIFGEDTIYEKPRPTTPSEPRSHQTSSLFARRRSEGRPQLEKNGSDHTVLHHKSRRPQSLRSSLRRFPLTDSSLGMANNTPASPLSPSHDPLSSFLAKSRHTRSSNRSDSSGSSYFGFGRRQQHSSDQPLSASPMATHWEADTTTSGNNGDDSELLSPTTMKPSTLKWAYSVRGERSREKNASSGQPSECSDKASAPSSIASNAPALPNATYKSSDGKEYQATSLTGPGAPNFLPSEMKRIDTPPLEVPSARQSRLRALKSFFFDVESPPKEADGSAAFFLRDTEIIGRPYARIFPKTSLRSLVPKLSLPTLRHKPSEILDDRRDSDPFAVTDFQQTPFSQRYGDALRAKQALMRAYMWDETLREDDDSNMGSVGHSFELSIPDHLTNSPLCPLNEKHKSGGKGLCPVHGRKRMSVNAYPYRGRAGGRREGSKGGRREPTIVFESGQQGNGSMGMGGNGD